MCKKRKTNLLAGLIWLYVLMSLKCVKKTGSQLYYLSSMLFEFDYKDGLIGDLCDSGWQLVTICE